MNLGNGILPSQYVEATRGLDVAYVTTCMISRANLLRVATVLEK